MTFFDTHPEPIRVLGLAGSLRQASYNRALLRAAVELAPEGLRIETADLLPIPLYNGDVEAEGAPEPVQALRARLEAAHALLVVTPEYNGGMPGVLKNTIDWLSRPPRPQPFDGKPIGILGATPGNWGTIGSQDEARYTLARLAGLVMPQPRFLVAGAGQKFADGELVDEDTRARLTQFLQAFGAWVVRLIEPAG